MDMPNAHTDTHSHTRIQGRCKNKLKLNSDGHSDTLFDDSVTLAFLVPALLLLLLLLPYQCNRRRHRLVHCVYYLLSLARTTIQRAIIYIIKSS